MSRRAAEAVTIAGLATVLTMAMAAPVLRAPSQRLFGMEIVGRHHDPFTAMQQFAQPPASGMYLQPVTDLPGALLARLSGVVAAFNWLVLFSFPLSAASAYLLARHLTLAPAGAAVAAFAFAFSPFHLAHAAYHPHVSQTQWIPLYLLALWRCLERPSPTRAAALAGAAIAVTLSNIYGGLIAAAVTPTAACAYWIITRPGHADAKRRLAVTAGSLILAAAGGLLYATSAAPHAVTFARGALFAHSAKWWSYLVPPVAHPLFGEAAGRFWSAAGVREGLLEHQVSLGWAVVVLALVASVRWALEIGTVMMPRHTAHKLTAPVSNAIGGSLTSVPMLASVALTALVFSLSPERTIGAFTFVRPSALLYEIAPMFRSYARFGVVVQLMAALMAGIGVDWLRRTGTRRCRVACAVLVCVAALEYTAAPSRLWRDVLPTTAHRWVTRQSEAMRVLDCTRLSQESASVQWLTGGRVTMLGGEIADCSDASLPQSLALNHYTHLLVRKSAGGPLVTDGRPPPGLRVAAAFADAQLFAVTAPIPAVYTAAMTGFFPRERGGGWSWRWMGPQGAWTVVNTTSRPVVASVGLQLSAFNHRRRLDVLLDGQHRHTLVVEPPRRTYEVGPLTIVPGVHELVFRPVDPTTPATDSLDNGDPRRLSFALGTWTWTVRGEEP